MINVSYGREGEKAFKYGFLNSKDYNVDNLLGRMVQHCQDNRGYDVSLQNIYPEENIWFSIKNESKEIRIVESDEGVSLDFGMDVQSEPWKKDGYMNCQAYLDEVWSREIEGMLEENKRENDTVLEIHDQQQTRKNVFDQPGRSTV